MADTSQWDITQSTIAVVIRPPDTHINLEESDLRPLLRPPYSISQTPIGETAVLSNRDRVEVIFNPAKINVRDYSGRDIFAESTVPSVLSMLVEKYNSEIRSFGINFVILIPNADPENWICNVLLNPSIEKATNLHVLGGQARLSLQSDPKTWNISFQQTQDNSGIEVNFNASEDAEVLPTIEELQQSMDDQLMKLRSFMDQLKSLEVRRDA